MMGDADVPLTNRITITGCGPYEDGGLDLKPADAFEKERSIGNSRDHIEADTPNRKKTENDAEIRLPHQQQTKGKERVDTVNVSDEHRAAFMSYVQLFIDYIIVKAMRVVVNDYVKKCTDEETLICSKAKPQHADTRSAGGMEPIFSVTDESYVDVIDKEIEATIESGVQNGDRGDGVFDEASGGLYQPTEQLNASETFGQASPILHSENDEVFEMAEQYLDESPREVKIDDNNAEANEASFQETSRLTKDHFVNYNFNDDGHERQRRAYEFEVDCETGMISSREYEMEPVTNDGISDTNGRLAHFTVGDDVEDDTDGDVRNSFVELEADVSSLFQVIDDDNEGIDESDSVEELTRKLSSFRARSPTKLPRSVRDNTESFRRRCVSMGDAQRYEFLDSPSSEFYSNPDAIDRIYVLPSPPRCPPDDDQEDDASGDENQSSSREELSAILDDRTDGMMAVMEQDTTSEPVESLKEASENYPTTHVNGPSDEPSSASSIEQIEMPTAGELDEMENQGDIVPIGHQLRRGSATRDSGIIIADDFDICLDNESGSTDTGPDYVGDDNEQQDESENLFDYIRRRRGRLRRREVNELLTDLGREKEEMERMLREARRAKEEFAHLQEGVKNLLARLDHRATAGL